VTGQKPTIKKLTGLKTANECAESTSGRPCGASSKMWFKSEHSPIRAFLYRITVVWESYVSVHFVRHKIGVEHYVQSLREDRGGNGTEDRMTPVKHTLVVNAQALIGMARKRLCLSADRRTVAGMTRICNALHDVEPELAPFLVPECVYRGGYCPEPKECDAGVVGVVRVYARKNPAIRAYLEERQQNLKEALR